jgi:hypothetical protein
MKFSMLFSTLFIFLAISFSGLMASDRCVNCSSSSSCKQCRLDNGKDNQKNRKKCEQMGCKIVGTGPCSKAANVKVCN